MKRRHGGFWLMAALMLQGTPGFGLSDFVFGACTHTGEVLAGGGITPEELTQADVDRIFDLMAAAGVEMYREDLYWHLIEPAKGNFNFTPYDTVINAAAARGIKPLAVLAYRAPWTGPLGSDEMIADYVNYCTVMVNRYKDRIKHWEVWNEESLNIFWNPPDPVAYAKLLIAASKAIKAADPTAKVIFGGVHALDSQMTEPYHYVGKALAVTVGPDRAFDAVDFIAAHAYMDRCTGSSPENHMGRDLAGHYKRFNDYLIATYGQGKEYWHTETGWSTLNSGCRKVTEEQQASYIVRTNLNLIGSGLVKSMFQYDFRNDGTNPALYEHNMGQVNFDYTPKKLFHAYKVMTERLKPTSFTGKLPWTDAFGYIFTDGSTGKKTYALWTTGANVTKTVPVASSNAVVYDLAGGSAPASISGGNATVTLNGNPVFLVEGAGGTADNVPPSPPRNLKTR